MALFTKHEIRLVAATDGTSYKTKVFERDDQQTHEVERSDLATVSSGVASIASGGSATFTIPIGDINQVSMLYIEVDRECEVTLKKSSTYYIGNASNGLVIKPPTSGKARMFIEVDSVADPDGIIVKNLDATNACVCSFFLAGDNN